MECKEMHQLVEGSSDQYPELLGSGTRVQDSTIELSYNSMFLRIKAEGVPAKLLRYIVAKYEIVTRNKQAASFTEFTEQLRMLIGRPLTGKDVEIKWSTIKIITPVVGKEVELKPDIPYEDKKIPELLSSASEKIKKKIRTTSQKPNQEIGGLSLFIPPIVSASLQQDEKEQLDEIQGKVDEFLDSVSLRTLLLLGDAGSGKSLFCRRLWQMKWENYQPPSQNSEKKDEGIVQGKPITLLIELAKYAHPDQDLLYAHLVDLIFDYDLTVPEVQAILTQPLICICDGYDEMTLPLEVADKKEKYINLYRANQWKVWHTSLKVIITCRSQGTSKLVGNYRDYFYPNDENGDRSDYFVQWVIRPFRKDIEIKQYIKNYVQVKKGQQQFVDTTWTVEKYENAIGRVQNLYGLIGNPFLLFITLEVLPTLLADNIEISLSRASLYQAYTERHFRRIENNLKSDGRISEITKIREYFLRFSLDLAEALFREYKFHDNMKSVQFKKMSFSVKNKKSVAITNKNIRRFFEDVGFDLQLLNTDKRPSLALLDEEKCPALIRFNDKGEMYYYVYGYSESNTSKQLKLIDDENLKKVNKELKTLNSDFANNKIINVSKDDLKDIFELVREFHQVVHIDVISSGCLLKVIREGEYGFLHNSLWEYFVARVIVEELELLGPTNLKDLDNKEARHIFNEKYLTEERGVLDFVIDLLERADKRREIEDKLLAIVKLSCSASHVEWASSNAMSVLSGMHCSFSGLNLSSVKIPHSDLSNSIFDHTKLSHSDLTGTNLKNVFLRDSELDGTNFSEASLSEYLPFTASSEIRSFSVSQSGRWVAAGCSTGALNVWDESDPSNSFEILNAHNNDVSAICFSLNEENLVTASIDMIRVWDLQDSKLECRVLEEVGELMGYVDALAFDTEGKNLAAARGKVINLWETQNWTNIGSINGDDEITFSLCYHPVRTDQLAFCGQSKIIKIWNLRSSKIEHELRGHNASLKCVRYSQEGKFLVSAGDNPTILVWDTENYTQIFSLVGHHQRIRSLNFFEQPNSSLLLSYAEDGAKVWDVSNGSLISTVPGNYVNSITSSFFVGSIIYLISNNEIGRYEKQYIFSTSNILEKPPETIVSLFYNKQSDTIYYSNLKEIRTCNLSHNMRQGVILSDDTPETKTLVLSVSDDSRTLVTGHIDGTVMIWINRNGYAWEKAKMFSAHTGGVVYLRIHSNNLMLFTAGRDRSVNLWEYDQQFYSIKKKWDIKMPTSIWGFDFCSRTNRLVFLSREGSMYLLNLTAESIPTTGESIAQYFYPNIYASTCVKCHPKSEKILTGTINGQVVLWSATGEQYEVFDVHKGRVNSIDINSDGNLLLTCSNDCKIKLLDLNNKSITTIFEGEKPTFCVSWLTETSFAIAGADRSIKVWKKHEESQKWLLEARSYADLFIQVENIGKATGISACYLGLFAKKNVARIKKSKEIQRLEYSHNDTLSFCRKIISKSNSCLNGYNANGYTPLHIACHNKRLDVVTELVQIGADVNMPNRIDGQTPLYIASLQGDLQIAKYLLEMKADINAATYYTNWTPLIGAVVRGNVEMVRLLMRYNPDVSVAVKHGEDLDYMTAVDIAIEKGMFEIFDLLMQSSKSDLSQ